MANLYPGIWRNNDKEIELHLYLSNDGHRLLIYQYECPVMQKYYAPDRRQEAVLDAWNMADMLDCHTYKFTRRDTDA